MSLSIAINHLGEMKQYDEEGFAYYQQIFAHLNDVLKDNELPAYQEPIELINEHSRAPITSFPYSFLHYLRWVEIQLSVNPQSPLIPINSNDELDDKLNSVDFVDFMDNPLINHADNEGYYLPVDFDEVLFDDVENQSLGSSHHLMAILQDIAPHLGISLVDGKLTDEEIARLNQRIDDERAFYRELIVWLALFEASRLSIQYYTAIVFA